jgi:hypothetical protein
MKKRKNTEEKEKEKKEDKTRTVKGKGDCLSSGYCNKLQHISWVIKKRNLFLTILETRSPRSDASRFRF